MTRKTPKMKKGKVKKWRMRQRARRVRFLAGVAFLIAVVFSFTSAGSVSAAKWYEVHKEDWAIKKMGTDKVHKQGNAFDLSWGYATQGGIVTKYNYVYSEWSGDDSEANYLVFVNKKKPSKVTKIKGNWGHMNSFYYDWDTGYILVKAGDKSACYKDANSGKNIKRIEYNACVQKMKDNKSYAPSGIGTPEVNIYGKKVQSGKLTQQGEAADENYIYAAGWDGNANGNTNTNALFIFTKDRKKLVRTIAITKPKGELEDVSLDKNGNIYLWFLFGSSGGIRKGGFYEINRSDLQLPKLEKKDDGDSGKSSNGGETDTILLDSKTIDGTFDLVTEILAIGIPILGILGITIVGIQWLTAGGDNEKITKAKRRMIGIVIGLVAYVVLFALFNFLGLGKK